MDTSSFLPPITQKQTDRQMKIFILLREKKKTNIKIIEQSVPNIMVLFVSNK